MSSFMDISVPLCSETWRWVPLIPSSSGLLFLKLYSPYDYKAPRRVSTKGVRPSFSIALGSEPSHQYESSREWRDPAGVYLSGMAPRAPSTVAELNKGEEFPSKAGVQDSWWRRFVYCESFSDHQGHLMKNVSCCIRNLLSWPEKEVEISHNRSVKQVLGSLTIQFQGNITWVHLPRYNLLADLSIFLTLNFPRLNKLLPAEPHQLH